MPDGPDSDIVPARCQPHAEIVNEAFFTADKWRVTLCEHENPHSGESWKLKAGIADCRAYCAHRMTRRDLGLWLPLVCSRASTGRVEFAGSVTTSCQDVPG